jgi:AraC-like DNA-binding protein
MNYNFGVLLSFLVAFQFLFVAIYLFTHKKGNKRNNSLLGSLFLLFAISLMDFTIRVNGIVLPISLLHLLDDGFFFLYGPVIYFYVQGVVFSDFRFTTKDALHLIPYLGYTAYLVYHLIFIDLGTQSEVVKKVDAADLPAWIYFASMLFYIHIISYLWISWRILLTYQSIIKDKFSSIDEINLEWLSFMIRAFATITAIALIHNLLPVFGNIFFLYSSVIVLLIVTFLFINRVIVKALNQPAIFSGIALKETEKYASSNVQQATLEGYKVQLQQLMEDEQLYLKPELTSQDLAEQLNISSKVLSQVINQGFNKNFFDYVNSYRCEKVKQLLLSADKKITIIEAMYMSGFNSKSSFNKEFKKLTGQTPSEFKKN